MDVRYRPATPHDAHACIVLRGMTRENAVSAERLAQLGITVERWADDIRFDRLPGFVCLSSDQMVGYCFGDTTTGEVVVLALLPQAENYGIGKTLLGMVVKMLKARGFERLFLGCSADPRVRSYGFYRHLGWRSTGAADARGDEILEYFP